MDIITNERKEDENKEKSVDEDSLFDYKFLSIMCIAARRKLTLLY